MTWEAEGVRLGDWEAAICAKPFPTFHKTNKPSAN